MSEPITAYGGAQVPVNDLEVTVGYTGAFVTTLTVSYGVDYVQTFVRDGSGNVLVISQWIPQAGPAQEKWAKEGLPALVERLTRVLERHKRVIAPGREIKFLGAIDQIGVAK